MGADLADLIRPRVQTRRCGGDAVGVGIVDARQTSGLGEGDFRGDRHSHRSDGGVLPTESGDQVCKVYGCLYPSDVGRDSGADLLKGEVCGGLQGLRIGGGP